MITTELTTRLDAALRAPTKTQEYLARPDTEIFEDIRLGLWGPAARDLLAIAVTNGAEEKFQKLNEMMTPSGYRVDLSITRGEADKVKKIWLSIYQLGPHTETHYTILDGQRRLIVEVGRYPIVWGDFSIPSFVRNYQGGMEIPLLKAEDEKSESGVRTKKEWELHEETLTLTEQRTTYESDPTHRREFSPFHQLMYSRGGIGNFVPGFGGATMYDMNHLRVGDSSFWLSFAPGPCWIKGSFEREEESGSNSFQGRYEIGTPFWDKELPLQQHWQQAGYVFKSPLYGMLKPLLDGELGAELDTHQSNSSGFPSAVLDALAQKALAFLKEESDKVGIDHTIEPALHLLYTDVFGSGATDSTPLPPELTSGAV